MEVRAFSDRKTVALNESFVFTIKISTDKGKLGDVNIQNMPHLENFQLTGQWSNQESSVNIVNTNMSRSVSVLKNYRFQPKKKGKFTIPSLMVKAQGRMFKTRPVGIIVTGNNPNPPSQVGSSSPVPGLPRSVFDIRGQQQSNIRLHLDVDKKSVYKTERIRSNWFILESSSRYVKALPHKRPVLKGFWKEDVNLDQQKKALSGTQVINGVLYRRRPVDSLWIFPLQTGKLKIDSYSVRFHHFFTFPGQEDIRSFPSQAIQIKALPTQGLDDSFTGAVGSFKMDVSLDKTSTVTHRPLSYKITFEGSGHPRFISLPSLEFPDSLITYSPAEQDHFSDSGQGKKEFEILIIPKLAGIINIPSFKFSTFDPGMEQYVFHHTPAFSISVAQGSGESEEGENFLGSDKKEEEKPKEFQPLTGTYWPQFIRHKNLKVLWLAVFGFCMIWFGFLYIRNSVFKKEKSFKKRLKQRFKMINSLLKKKDWQGACEQMIRVNYDVLYSASVTNSPSDWKQALDNLSPILNKKYALQFESLFRELEDLSFSKKSHFKTSDLNRAKDLLTHTKTLIHSFLSDL